MTLAASPARPLIGNVRGGPQLLCPMMGSIADRRRNSLAFDDPEDAALLARDEDAARVLGAVAAVSRVDIGALDRAVGEPLDVFDDIAEGMAIVGIVRQCLHAARTFRPGHGGWW